MRDAIPVRTPTQNVSLPPVKVFSAEWAIIKYLEGWRPDDIRIAIRNKTDLVALLRQYEYSTGWLVRLVRGNVGDLQNYLEPTYILLWFRERLPSLHEAIVSEQGGEAWLQENFQRLKTYLQI